MNWNCSETVWNFIKALWRKIVETQETHEAVPTSIRRRLTLVNSCFYDDILDICWSVPKMPSYKEIFFILQNLIVLSTVMFENFFGKNWCTETFQRVTFTIFKTSPLLTVSDTLYSPCALETLLINSTHFWYVIKSIMEFYGDFSRNNFSLSTLV